MSIQVLRSHKVDALRGIAVIAMVCANSAACGLAEPHPLWLRIYGSLAAPLFITLSGMMVQHAFLNKKRNFLYFLGRAGLTVLISVLIDVFLWKIMPFSTVDVLYLIGIAIPIVYLFRNISVLLKCLLVLLIIFLTPLLQNELGYTNYPSEFDLAGNITIATLKQTNIVNHWFVDGWFPLFPWLGFSLFGSVLADIKNEKFKMKFSSIQFLIIGFISLLAGLIMWKFNPVSQIVREGYSELFYPPTIAYCFCAIGVIMILFFIVEKSRVISDFHPFRFLGECSLFMYILHLAVIALIIDPFIGKKEIDIFICIYMILLASLICIAAAIHYLKLKVKKMPYLLRFLIGG